MVKKICKTCGKEFEVIQCREKTAKYCCKKCAGEAAHGANNATCTNCGKPFHMKPTQMDRYKRTMGFFCSIGCSTEYRKVWFRGEGNHQYGLKGNLNSSFKGEEISHRNHNKMDIYVYDPTHPFANKEGRVVKHRLIVEENHSLFDDRFFETIEGRVVLKKKYSIHHKDGNHDNNDINNLQVVTKSEHTAIHNKEKVIIRDSKGRITGVIKQGELLGNHNQVAISSQAYKAS